MTRELIVRPEEPGDHAAVHDVEAAAFQQPLEADLVDALREDPAYRPELSLIALEDEKIVGHVILTEMGLSGEPRSDVLALGPMGVLPARQGHGVGRRLVEEAIKRADAEGGSMIVLVGDPGLYGRFGFRPAGEFGISSPPYPDEHLQVLPLAAYDEAIRGQVSFAPPFDDAEARELASDGPEGV